jgi:hypothetical protein
VVRRSLCHCLRLGAGTPCGCFVRDLLFVEPRRFGLSVSETYHRASLPTKTRYFPRLLWRRICRQSQLSEADAICLRDVVPRGCRRVRYGHEYLIDRLGGDIFVWRIRLLRAGSLVLNSLPASAGSNCLSRPLPYTGNCVKFFAAILISGVESPILVGAPPGSSM